MNVNICEDDVNRQDVYELLKLAAPWDYGSCGVFSFILTDVL